MNNRFIFEIFLFQTNEDITLTNVEMNFTNTKFI